VRLRPPVPGPVRQLQSLLTPAQQRSAFVLLVLMLLGTALETLGVGLLLPALALIMEPDIQARYPAVAPLIERLGSPSHAQLVAGGMLALFVVYAVKSLYLAFMAWRQMRFVFEVQAVTSQRLFAGYLRQPWTFHLQRNSTQLIRNALSETSIVTASGLMPGLMLLSELLVVAGIVLLLLVIEPVGAVVVGATLGFAALAFQLTTRGRVLSWGRARQHHEGQRLRHLNQGLSCAKDVKLLGREADFLSQYRIHNEATARFQRRQATVLHMPRLWFELLAVMGLTILVLVMLAQQHAPAIVLPTLGLFAAAAFRLMPSMNRILNALQNVRYAVPAIDTVASELRLIEREIPPAPRSPLLFERVLDLEDVSFTYNRSALPALNDVHIEIPRGATVGFIGGSGAGKTTLVDVVLGLLPPQKGTVRVDGVDIRTNLRGWQDQIGYVPQTVVLTDDSLRRNIGFGFADVDIDEAAVARAVEAAQLSEFVAELPEGLDTVVGERGVRLSGGQRQRIGIARALYHDPSVLVLDEATSSLDTSTEEGVMEAIRALHGDKTILVVAHRLSTVTHCDSIYRLERGRIVDRGEAAAVLGRFGSGAPEDSVGVLEGASALGDADGATHERVAGTGHGE
jgi:ATP-binding cassette, subfamily B, bacterial PglK